MRSRLVRRDRIGAAAAAMALLLLVHPPGDAPVGALPYPAPAFTAVVLEPSADSDAPHELVAHLARRYRISAAAAQETTQAAYVAAGESGLDPLLVLAVIGVESSFNPSAESHRGAKGLMQIIPRYHLAKLSEHGGEALVLEPLVNITVGTRILVEYIERRGGLEPGLQLYNGAARDDSARYARKVIAERDRLEAIVALAAE